MVVERRDAAAELRAAFISGSAREMPAVRWHSTADGSLEYPETSVALGSLVVGFGWDDITVFVGNHHHRHFDLLDDDSDPGSVAANALWFVQDITGDRLVFRLGKSLSSAYRPARLSSRLFRVWRALTPGVREAVWSGRRVR